MLQDSKYFEDSFQIYERGIALFKWPHVKDIWQAYLTQFVERYKGTKLERARDLFKQALETVDSPCLETYTRDHFQECGLLLCIFWACSKASSSFYSQSESAWFLLAFCLNTSVDGRLVFMPLSCARINKELDRN